MFYLLNNEKPSKKLVAVGAVNDLNIVYTATRTREIINGYDKDGTCVASIYSTMSILRTDDEDIESSKVQVSGRWEEIQGLAGLGTVTEEPPTFEQLGLEVDKQNKGSAGKVKGLQYEEHGSGGLMDMSKIGTSIEDYLYEIREMKDIEEELELDLRWADKKDYRVLVTDEDIKEFVDGLDACDKDELVGFDTETTGLLVNRTKLDKLVGISMSYKDHSGVYFPILHKRFDNVHMGTEELLDKLKPYCDRGSKKRKKLVTHNGGFDWKVLKMHGWDLNIVYDTWIRHGLMSIGEAKYMSALKPMAKRMLGHDVVEMSEMYKNRTPKEVKSVVNAVVEQGLWVDDITKYKLERTEKFDDVKYDFRFASYDFSKLYGSADADFPRLIHKLMDEKWDSKLDFIYRLEIALIPVIGEQEYYGVKVNEEEFENLRVVTEKRLMELETAIYKEAGQEFKISSPVQKAEILFDVLGCPFLPRFRTKKGGRGTDKNVMETLAQFKNKDGSAKYPIVELLQEYSKKSTLISNFYGKLPKLVHKGFIFPSYNQLGTETGRLSCYAPNLQQTEGTSRHHMIPDSDDYYFMICDYSQVEYRLMAGLSGEKKVVEFFSENPEADYHILAYANMMNKAYEDVTAKERKTGKVLNFGTTYGLEDENLALKLYGDSTEFHQAMAREARDMYFAGVPVLRDYFESIRDLAEEQGFAETKFGRVRAIGEFLTKRGMNISEYLRSSGRRKAGNMPVQGTAADIMKMAMIRVRNAFRKAGFKEDMVRLVLNVHDELGIQVHKSISHWHALYIIRNAMEIDLSADGFPPLYIGANVGYSWADGKVDELEAPVILMDEKMAEVKELMDKGEPIPTQQDQRQEWLMDIRKFAVNQVKKEIVEKGHKTVEDAHSNARVIKYSRTFNNPDMVVYLLLTQSADEVWNKIPKIEAGDEYVWEKTEKVVEVKGVEEEETADTLKEKARKCIKYSKKSQKIRILLEEQDTEFLTILDKMLVTRASMDAFRNDQIYLKVEVQFGKNSDAYEVTQRGLLSGMLKLLLDFLVTHLVGGSYGYYEEKIEDVGTKLLKEYQKA